MTQPETVNQPALRAVPTPQAPPSCKDPFNDKDRWVLWVLLRPMSYLCHTKIAQALAVSYCGDDGGPGLVWEDNKFWRYDNAGGAWSEYPLQLILKRLNLLSGHGVGEEKPRPISLQQRDKRSIISCLETECTPLVPVFEQAREGIAFRNGFLTDDFELEAHDPENFARWSLDCDYFPEPELRAARRYEGSLFDTFWGRSNLDPDQRQLIGEHMFSALTGTSTKYGRILLLVGKAGSGKSQVLEMYRNLVPKGSACVVPPHRLHEDYHAINLHGKALNAVTEVDKGVIKNESAIKAIAHGEHITARAVRRETVTFRALCAHVFCANELPELVAPDPSFYDRWALVRFRRRLRGTSDAIKGIGKRVAREELGLLVSWVVECGKKLRSRGDFALTPQHQHLIKKWQSRGDSVAAWLAEDTTEVEPGTPAVRWPTMSDLFDRYLGWSSRGRFQVVNRTEFTRRLKLQGVRIKHSDGKRANRKVKQ